MEYWPWQQNRGQSLQDWPYQRRGRQTSLAIHRTLRRVLLQRRSCLALQLTISYLGEPNSYHSQEEHRFWLVTTEYNDQSPPQDSYYNNKPQFCDLVPLNKEDICIRMTKNFEETTMMIKYLSRTPIMTRNLDKTPIMTKNLNKIPGMAEQKTNNQLESICTHGTESIT